LQTTWPPIDYTRCYVLVVDKLFIVLVIIYLGKRNTVEALTPKLALLASGAARLNRGPIENCTFRGPKLVTALIAGLNHIVVVLASQWV